MFKNLVIFDFESICVPSDQLKDTNTTTWIGKHEPISVSISSNIIDEPVFLCDNDPKALIISFVEAIEDLANKSKTEMWTKFSSIEAIIRARVNSIGENLIKRKDQNAQHLSVKMNVPKKMMKLICLRNFSKCRKTSFWTYSNTLSVM